MLNTQKNLRGFLAATLIILSCSALTGAPSVTEDGWIALKNNEDKKAISTFESAIATNPGDVRALTGLMYAYDLQFNDDKAWEAFRRVLEVSPNRHSLLFASVLSRRFQSQLNKSESGLEDILRGVIDNPDPSGIMQAMAIEQVGALEEARGHVADAKSLYSKLGAVMDWRLMGPFDNVSASGHDKVFRPEKEDDPNAVYKGADGRDVWWFTPKNYRVDRWVDMAMYFPSVSGVFYANTYVYAEEKKRVQIRVGTSGSFRLFLNNTLINESLDEHNNDVDTYIVEVLIPKGWSRLLMKNANSELNRCNFLLRITNADGSPVDGLSTHEKLSGTIQSSNQTASRAIANPHILSLQSAWDSNPQHLEHAWLLTEAFLRNDQADDAERVITAALDLAPNCATTLTLLAETYQRGRRSDELTTTTERLVHLRPDLPFGLIYSFNQALESDKLEEANQLLSKIKARLPNSREYFSAAISIAYRKEQLQEADKLREQAFQVFPEDASFAAAAAVQTLRSTGSHDAALEVVDRHLAARYSESGLMLRSRLLYDARRYSEWEKAFELLFELSPASPGYHIQMADAYKGRKEYQKAIKSVRAALADAPYVSGILDNLGTLLLATGDSTEAKEVFELAVRSNPANFSARKALRDANNEPEPLSYLVSSDIDSMMAVAPTKDDFPSADAIVVFDDTKRVVYDGSRCEMEYEVLIRILTPAGIDTYHEMYLSGGSKAIVEKAAVYKKNGTEIPADVYQGRAVFKSLEPGDFVYYKTKSKEWSVGALSGYFQDETLFSMSEPIIHVRYQLLVPPKTNFQWKVAGGVIPVQTSTTDYGDAYLWELRNLAAAVEELDSPDYESTATMLQVSSIPRWSEVIEWYHDVARTKTRSSPSISRLMDTLFPRSGSFTKKEIIEGVYKYITTEIRYSFVDFRQANQIPQKARDVLATRIGDCKDVSSLCIAMLAERDIEAFHTLVETNSYGVTRPRLPTTAYFDHVVVMIDLDGVQMYVDCTAPDNPFGSVPFADIDAHSLVIYPGWMMSQRIDRGSLPPNNTTVTSLISIHDDLSATITRKYQHTGTRTSLYRNAWKDQSDEDMKKSLLQSLASSYGEVTVTDYSISFLDTLAPIIEYSVEFEADNFVMETANFYILRVPWNAPFESSAALSTEKRTHPLQYRHYVDTLHEELTVFLPDGYQALGLESSAEHESVRATISRSAEEDKNRLRLTRTQVNLSEVVPTSEYVKYKKFHNEVVLADRQAILLAPAGTKVTTPRKRESGNSTNK